MSAESGSVRCVNLKRKSGRGGIRTSRAKGNRREDRVLDLLDERGRHAVVLRGSGCRGVQQQRRDRYVAGDVIAFPRLEDVGVQFAVGGPGKRPGSEFSELRKGALPGFALSMVEFYGAEPRRWLRADVDGGWTVCEGCDDLLATIRARSRGLSVAIGAP